MIILMTTTGRHQRRYDHRLQDLVRRTGDVTIATDLGIPRSTARGWLAKAPNVIVSLDVTNRNASEVPARSLGAPPTREEAQSTPSARGRAASDLRIPVDPRASARGTRQNQDLASSRSCPCVCAVTSASAVPGIFPESVPCLATAAARVYA